MGLSKFRIGQLVEQTTEINTDYLFGADDVRGMTITKQIIPTKADVSVADLSKFLVIHPKEFVFNPRTHGKHLDITIQMLVLLYHGITSALELGRKWN